MVKKDISKWLDNRFMEFLIETNPSIKTLWQLVEEMGQHKNKTPQYQREVQGVTKRYEIPVPGLDKGLTQKAVKKIREYIYVNKSEQNRNLGKVWLDEKLLKKYPIQYSGADSNDIQMSGKYLPEGYKMKIQTKGIIRLGLAWSDKHGYGSSDLDLNTVFFTDNNGGDSLYFGSPELYNDEGELIGVSSGDITYSETDRYSVEFIDIDISKIKKAGYLYALSSVYVYSSIHEGLYGQDAHIFFKILGKNKMRKINNNKDITVDLMDQDYAVKTTCKERAMIGFYIDFVKNEIQFVMQPLKTNSNVVVNDIGDLKRVVNNFPNRLSLYKVLKGSFAKDQLVDNREDADITIGGSGCDINVMIEPEKISKIVF